MDGFTDMTHTIKIPARYHHHKDLSSMIDGIDEVTGKINDIQAASIYSTFTEPGTSLPPYILVAHLFNKERLDEKSSLDTVIWAWQHPSRNHTPLPIREWRTLFESTWWASRDTLGSLSHKRSPRNEMLPEILYRGGSLTGPSWTRDPEIAEFFASQHKDPERRKIHSINPRAIQERSFIYPIQIGKDPGPGIGGEQEFWILPTILEDIPRSAFDSQEV